jgi:hypothetical protein
MPMVYFLPIISHTYKLQAIYSSVYFNLYHFWQ